MHKFFVSFAVAVAALPAAASAETTQSKQFTHEGVAYSYSVTGTADGWRVEGTADHRPFVLRVKNNVVTGTFNGYPVSFKASDVKRNLGIAEIASR